jgi:hypothetical protein
LPESKAEVLKEILEALNAPLDTAFLLNLLHSAQLPKGSVSSFLRVHSSRDVLVDQPVEMKRQLVPQLLFDELLAKERSASEYQLVDPAHWQEPSITSNQHEPPTVRLSG